MNPAVDKRQRLREEIGTTGNFVEIFMATSAADCAARDLKGMYAKAMRGKISDFTGVNSPYDILAHPEIRLETKSTSPATNVDTILRYLTNNELLS